MEIGDGMNVNLSNLTTETRNPRTANIDKLSTVEILTIMNEEDETIASSVKRSLPQIKSAVELVYSAFQNGGRLYYVGAGTSGRLGVLDAAECPPTFKTEPDMVKAVLAGGKDAIFTAIEGVEDRADVGAKDLAEAGVKKGDVVIGITASGRTPYVIGALDFAKKMNATTVGLSCNKQSELKTTADHSIEIIVGPEVITGSTRLKAATAQKMALNMITTASMIKLGKVYENLMVDMKASNSKLKNRARNMVMMATQTSYESADSVLKESKEDVKHAIVMIEGEVSFEESKRLLEKGGGLVRHAIKLSKTHPKHDKAKENGNE